MKLYFFFILSLCGCLAAVCVPNNTHNYDMASDSITSEVVQVLDVEAHSHIRRKTKIERFEESEELGISASGGEIWCNKVNCDKDVPTHLKYWYYGYCKDKFPDFAALAVFESKSCPPINNGKPSLCTSRYRIIRILDAVSDTLKKEYIEVKEALLLPHFRYRPILIFGNYNNGVIQINGYEEVREYFSPHMHMGHFSRVLTNVEETIKITGDVLDQIAISVYSFHSIGNPYYNANTLDSVERIYYNEYLIPEMKIKIESVGKNFNELWQRLTKNRTDIKTAVIRNDFAALGIVKNMYSIEDSNLKKKCMLDVEFETIIKNKTMIDSNITIYKYGDCPSITTILRPQYLFGNIMRDSLLIGSFVSTQNAFVFGDTIYDISMGFPFEEFLAYFLPSDLSVGEYVLSVSFKNEYIKYGIRVLPEPKTLIEAAILKEDSLRRDLLKKRNQKEIAQPSENFLWSDNHLFGYAAIERGFNRFRCRRTP
jgi:hypothetical protein